MKHVEHKVFTIFNYEEEEKWLNEKAAKGEYLTDVGFCRYVFEDGKPGEYTYRLEMLEEFPSHYKSVEYIRFLEDTDVEYVTSMLKWIYLRKKTSDGTFDIYSDLDSRIKHYNRIIKFGDILILLQLIISIPNIIASFSGGGAINNIYLINFLLAILFNFGNQKLKKKVNMLEKEKSYRE